MVAAHNPSTVSQSLLRFYAPAGGSYKAYAIAEDGQTWTEVPSDLLCYTATEDDSKATQFQACELFVTVNAPAQDITYLKIEATPSETNKAVPEMSKSPNEDFEIENENLHLKYVKHDEARNRAIFRLKNLKTGITQHMGFSLMYYNPATGDDGYSSTDNCPSGAYIFKPKASDSEKKVYSKYVGRQAYKGTETGVQAFALYSMDETTDEYYTSLVRLMPGANTVEWEVQMHGIPYGGGRLNRVGKEVVVNWEMIDDFDNESTFYTDSNGLEMQKRVLNYRPDFTLDTDEYASSNYYPIGSALAMRSPSTNMQLTVMNDRS